MRLGLGLGLTNVRGGAAPAWDAATVNASGLWIPNFTASPWTGQASGGASSGRNLTEGTNPPSASGGEAVFDGSNDLIAYATTSNLITDTEYTIAAVAKSTSPPANPGAGLHYVVPLIYGAFFGIGITSTGVCAWIFETPSFTYKTVHVAADTSGYVCVQSKFTGGVLSVRCNSGSWGTVASNPVALLSSPFVVGEGTSSKFTGPVRAVLTSQEALSDATLALFAEEFMP